MDDRLRSLLAELRERVGLAGRLVSVGLEEFVGDFRNRYALRGLVVELAEGVVDVCLHVVRLRGFRAPGSYRDCLMVLLENGVIGAEVYDRMVGLLRLRNIVVHRYWEVDDARLYRETRGGGLDAVLRFVGEVERRVDP